MQQFNANRSLEILATRTFTRWMRKHQVFNEDLVAATHDMVAGLIDANLGGHVVKKRVALQGRGKSSGARTIVATKFGRRWIFLFGFEKNERSNIDASELKALQAMAETLLGLDAAALTAALQKGELMALN